MNPAGSTPERASSERALYLYALGRRTGREVCIRRPGVDGSPVVAVYEGRWFALVHECPPQPYSSSDDETAIRWVLQHHGVLEEAMEAANDVIPVTFNTLIGRQGKDPYAALRGWIAANDDRLAALVGRIEGCREFGVQLVRDTRRVRAALANQSEPLQSIQRRIRESTPALAYLLRQELDQELAEALESDAAARAAHLAEELQRYSREVKEREVRPLEDGGDLEMVANFTCLLPQEQAEALLSALERQELGAGYSVRVTGPWPPYSFVSL